MAAILSAHHNAADAALGSDHHNFKPGTRKWGKRIANRRVRVQRPSLDMYDPKSGGWLHEAECESY